MQCSTNPTLPTHQKTLDVSRALDLGRRKHQMIRFKKSEYLNEAHVYAAGLYATARMG